MRIARGTGAFRDLMSEAKSPFGPLSAKLEERILQPLRAGAFARRTWFSVTVAAVVCLYAGLIGWLLWRDAADPPRGAEAQETPVEIVAEMPKPAVAAPQPAAQQEMEKPATSAPRAVNDNKLDTDSTDKDSHAAKTDAAKTPVPPKSESEADKTPERPAEAQEPSQQAPAKDDAKADPPKPPDVLDKDAEALDKLPPQPPKKPEKLAKAAPKPPPRPRHLQSAAEQLAGASQLPDYTFAKPMRRHAKVSGGSEDDRYLAVVYGMITQNRQPISGPYGDWAVAVSFIVDGGGNLIGVQVTRSSGYPEVDAQAVEAVESAAPFPPPPSGGNTGLVARLRSAGSEADARQR